MKGRIRMAFMVVLSFTLLMIPGIAPATWCTTYGPGVITGSWHSAVE